MKKIKNYTPGHKKDSVGISFNGRRHICLLYNHKWEKYREVFLKHNPHCYACGSKATVVDHIIPHQGDSKLFEKLDNHLPLCEKCHNTVTAYFDKKFKKGGTSKDKIEWMSWQRARLELKTKVKVLPKYEVE